jgi:excisionase family DNA binding protein
MLETLVSKRLLSPQSQQITMSVDEAMRATSLGRTKIYELLNEGCFRSVVVGKKRLIFTTSIVDYLNDLESYGIGKLGGE